MQPWERDRDNTNPNANLRKPWTIKNAIKHVGFGLTIAVLIYGVVIYQNIFMNQEDKERK
jgi:hypothetical protein